MKPGRLLAAAPVVTVATFALPIAAGLAGTLAPAFGYLPSSPRGPASRRVCG